jgi:BlaI family transcriptional regulator, penicillinase repressor
MKTLTKAEEQVMQILWRLKEGIVKDVVDKFDDPKPAYTTVATVLKVLENKGFVSCRKIGNINLFSPAIGKKDYANTQFSSFLKDYFSGSFPKLATFFARENNLSIDELEDMIRIAQNELKNEK